MDDVSLIDANALKEDLKNMLARVMYESDLDFDHSHAKIWTATITGIQHSIKRLDNAPTISAVPVVHGRWEDATEITAGIRFPQTRCTACGKVYWGYRTECYYCPNCGARMDGGADT